MVAVFPHNGQPFQFSKQNRVFHTNFVNKILYGFGTVNGYTDNFKRLAFELFAQAKAAAVFLNSTVGRLQLLRNPGRMLAFPNYSPDALKTIRLSNLSDNIPVDKLPACWERSRDMEVPQYRDGECEVRRLWDEAVAEAMGWDAAELQRLRHLLHEEPHVRGLVYEQYADEIEKQPG